AEEIARAHGVWLGVEFVQINRSMAWLPVDFARACKTSEAALAGVARHGMRDSYQGNRARGQHLFILYFSGAYDEIIRFAEGEIAKRGNTLMTTVVARLLRARAYLVRGDVDAAVDDLAEARALVPAEPRSALHGLLHMGEMFVRAGRGQFTEALAGMPEGERVMRETGAWLIGLSRSSWKLESLEPALALAAGRQLPPADRRQAMARARWLADKGVLDHPCMGDRAVALLEHAAGRPAAAERALARALTRSAARSTPHHRWLCLEAARDLGKLTLDLEDEASELAARHAFVLPPGWRGSASARAGGPP
ncbi:MAG TPA: hypothetical protein VHE35_15055, partial [Kofleriaceae bacterium]|nr:hypothetical protein [Kofleriaceae bacterium]